MGVHFAHVFYHAVLITLGLNRLVVVSIDDNNKEGDGFQDKIIMDNTRNKDDYDDVNGKENRHENKSCKGIKEVTKFLNDERSDEHTFKNINSLLLYQLAGSRTKDTTDIAKPFTEQASGKSLEKENMIQQFKLNEFGTVHRTHMTPYPTILTKTLTDTNYDVINQSKSDFFYFTEKLTKNYKSFLTNKLKIFNIIYMFNNLKRFYNNTEKFSTTKQETSERSVRVKRSTNLDRINLMLDWMESSKSEIEARVGKGNEEFLDKLCLLRTAVSGFLFYVENIFKKHCAHQKESLEEMQTLGKELFDTLQEFIKKQRMEAKTFWQRKGSNKKKKKRPVNQKQIDQTLQNLQRDTFKLFSICEKAARKSADYIQDYGKIADCSLESEELDVAKKDFS